MINNKEILDLITDYDIKFSLKKERTCESKRIKFVQKYPLSRINSLKLNEYVSGLKKAGLENYETFCYDLETGLIELGSIKGSTAIKFGIYYSTDEGTYNFAEKFGSTEEEAFSNIKSEITKLITYGLNDSFDKINKSILSPMFKYKILATYYPDKYICICSEPAIEEFLEIIGIEYNKKATMIEKQRLLLNWKYDCESLRNWSNYLLMRFLYDKFPTPSRQLNFNKTIQKEKDIEYSKKSKSKIKITKNEWIELFKLKTVFLADDIELLSTLFNLDNHACTRYELGIIQGISSSYMDSQIRNLGQRILNNLDTSPKLKDDGKERYWKILFLGRETESKLFEWKIRPELVSAMEIVFPNLESNKLNEDLDNKLIDQLKKDFIFSEEKMAYSPERKPKPEQYCINNTKVYKRDRKEALLALNLASYKCEIDKNHLTFIRRNSIATYTEPHHLIPLAYQEQFDVSLDVAANIVSLCSNCHNLIHYGKDAKELIELLFKTRKMQLEKAGIKLNLNKLLSFYNIK